MAWYKEEVSICDVCCGKAISREEVHNGIKTLKPTEFHHISENGITYCQFCYDISRTLRKEFGRDKAKLIEEHLEKIRDLEEFA